MAKGSGPIEYNDLFNQDVQAKLSELNSMVNVLDYSFQELAKSISVMSGRINVSIKGNATVIKELDTSLIALDVTQKGASETLSKHAKVLDETAKHTRNLKDQQEATNRIFTLSTASVDELKYKINALTKEYNGLERSGSANTIQLRKISEEAKLVKAQMDKVSLSFVDTSKKITESSRLYNQLSAALDLARKNARDIGVQFGVNSSQFDKASKSVTELDGRLKAIDAKLGQHTRNVGNYASAYNPLNQSIVQLSRELPTLAQSFQMFTLAISNNIGLLQDSISQLIAKNKELAAQGKPTQSVFKAITSAIFSWTTAISVATTLLIVFSKEIGDFASSLFASKKGLDLIKESQKAFNESLKSSEFKNAIEDVNSLRLNLGQAKKGFIDKTSVVDQYNKTLGLTLGITNDFAEVDKKVTNQGEAYIEMMSKRAVATALLAKASDAAVKAAEFGARSDKESLGFWDRIFISLGSDGSGNFSSDALTKELGTKNRDKLVKEQTGFFKDYIKLTGKAFDELGGLYKKAGIDGKTIADAELKSVTEIRKRISELQRMPGSSTVGSDLNNRIKELQARLKELSGSGEDAGKKLEAAFRKARKEADDLIKAQTKINEALLDKNLSNDLANASESDKTQILIRYENERLAIINAGADERLKLYKKGTSDYKEIEAEKITAATNAQEGINKATESGLKRDLELRKKYKKLDDEITGLTDTGTVQQTEFDIVFKKRKGTPVEREQQIQDELYEVRKQALVNDLLLVETRFASISDANEREREIKKETVSLSNELDKLSNNQFLQLQTRKEAAVKGSFALLQQNTQIMGELFGTEFGNLFTQLTTGLENFVENGKVSLEDLENFAIAGVRAIDEAYKQGTALRIEQLNLEKQAQIDIAGTNKDARLAIEDQYNKRIRAEKVKQARIDKAAAIFEITINTAVAASKVVGQTGIFGIGLVPIVIALGLAQIAAVLARPIPQFFKGRENGPATLAEVNEQGPELLEYKGKYRMANRGNRGVTYLRENEKVITAPVSKRILEMQSIDRTTELHGKLATNLHDNKRNEQVKTMSTAFYASRVSEAEIGREVGKEIAKLPFRSTIFDENGVSRFIHKQGTITKILNERYSLK